MFEKVKKSVKKTRNKKAGIAAKEVGFIKNIVNAINPQRMVMKKTERKEVFSFFSLLCILF
jgi:hypothetical protein